MELKGKKIAFLGDSITEGYGTSDKKFAYVNVMARNEELGAAFNYGASGTRIAHNAKSSDIPKYDLNFCGRAYLMDKSSDIIVVFGGTNDFGHGYAPFGTEEDKTPDTYMGAVEFLMGFLKTWFPQAKIVFLTPTRRINDENPAGNIARRGQALVLNDFCDVIKKKAAVHGYPVLDMYENFEIDPNVPELREKYTIDGLHFNDEGHAKLAETIANFLKSL